MRSMRRGQSLEKRKIGRSNYYMNVAPTEILTREAP